MTTDPVSAYAFICRRSRRPPRWKGLFRGSVGEMLAHAGEEIRHDPMRGEFRFDRLEAGEGLAGAIDLDAFSLVDPPGYGGERIAEMADGCRFHGETSLYRG